MSRNRNAELALAEGPPQQPAYLPHVEELVLPLPLPLAVLELLGTNAVPNAAICCAEVDPELVECALDRALFCMSILAVEWLATPILCIKECALVRAWVERLLLLAPFPE